MNFHFRIIFTFYVMIISQKAKNIFNRLRLVLRIALEIRLVIIML